MDHATLVFASVFPVASLSHTTPTPVATPDLGYTASRTSFGSPYIGNAGAAQQPRTVRRNLAWSTATRFLSLPRDADGRLKTQRRTRDVDEALSYLLVGEGKVDAQVQAEDEGLVEWFTNEVRLHFATVVRPGLRKLWGSEVELTRSWEILEETQQILARVQNVYMEPFAEHIVPFLHQDASNMTIRASMDSDIADARVVDGAQTKFQREIHAAFAHSLPPKRFTKTLSHVLYDAGCRLFRFYIRRDGVRASSTPENTNEIRVRMMALLTGIENVGLGGDRAQRAFAHAMNKIMDTFIASHYLKVDWSSRKSVVEDMRNWVENGFCPLVELVLECLRCNSTDVDSAQVKRWQEMAMTSLGKSRVENLFDFVINWDHSMGAILDLKEYLKLDGAKEHLKNSFSRQVSRRLLHPGATTTYILNVYISIIRAFHRLEPKGVLLQSVARPIRRYLKEREDTARIIISSLLVDVDDEASSKFASNSEFSYEIASEMAKPFAHADATDDELNWNDMNWQPLPHDASPEYKKSKVEDVIYFLLTLWDREDFINELKNILGDHLLRCQDVEYQKEIRLLELIKVRLGEDKLQACEVMLRDMLESRRINDTIRAATESLKRQNHLLRTPEPISAKNLRPRPTPSSKSSAPPHPPPPAPTLNAQILSSFFWPVLRDDDFQVPPEILQLQKDYASRFEGIKGMRKLRWMNALGSSHITLEFADRTEDFENLTPWQVSVIHAFQLRPGEDAPSKAKASKGEGLSRTFTELTEMLEMDLSLVTQALAFWIGKSVLRETSTSPSTYTVLERLSATTASDTDAAAAASELAHLTSTATATTIKSQADLLEEKREVYEAFILGMLTNQGNMPVGRILMMMRMMVQGGFAFGEDEVKGLCLGLEERGKVVGLGGGVWGIKK